MDILRNTIEAIFYHTPISVAANAVAGKINDPQLLALIKETIKWKDPSYTQSEIDLIDSVLSESWMHADDMGKATLLTRTVLILNEFSRQVLICDSYSHPIVDFDSLLRWRELSLCVGEDILTIPCLAKYDVTCGVETRSMLWPNVLDHNNFRLNAILDKELSDTHSHVNAATDIFAFNWLSLMNYMVEPIGTDKVKLNRDFLDGGMKMEYDRVERFSEFSLSLGEWVVVAAAIRVYIFSSLYTLPCEIKLKNIIEAFYDRERLENLNNLVRKEVASKGVDALATSNDLILDYAIRKANFQDGIPASPYMIHSGERGLLYQWFRKYYNNAGASRSQAGLILLYLLIQNKVRREFVQSNSLMGFSNFQEYQKMKFGFIPSGKLKVSYRELLFSYAVQTSLCSLSTHNLEARVCPNDLQHFVKADYKSAIFGTGLPLGNCSENNVTLVAHFIKKTDSAIPDDLTPRHSKLRSDLVTEIKTVVDEFKKALKEGPKKSIPIVGIDAASSELSCRPEVFAPFFRFAKSKGISNFTFHAGEDFYDIVDGLRTIYETVSFIGYKVGNRIGHGLALGTDPMEFYESRHNTVIIPRQILLDNLVWLKFFAAKHNILLNPSTSLMIEDYFHKLYAILKYPDVNDPMAKYRESMLLRGDYIENGNAGDAKEELEKSVLKSPVSPQYHNIADAKKLHKHYEVSKDCRIEGKKPEIVRFAKEYAKDVASVQEKLLQEIERQGIVIETNPSSNLKIGRFTRYDEHPIFKFHNVVGDTPAHSMVVSINTDDKGVFATSLKNEYSLIAIALRKQKDSQGNRLWSDLQIENYLTRIAHYGNISRFKVSDII